MSMQPTEALNGLRAAQYVRMSTEHQKYSTQNQADAIALYAARHNIEVVRTYADEGRSGLKLDGRQALKELISDVLLGRADFDCILVYDVSRWGRFQDADESAHYEFICREAGVQVQYCAEEFRNDGSLTSTIVKSLKRAMAAEYSRELSVKVFAAHCRFAKLGFKQGGPATYGMRRELIDENGNSKGLLKLGQRKHLQTDRVLIRPGNNKQELRLVREIFRQYVYGGKPCTRIARDLNKSGKRNHYGRPWTGWCIQCLLKNENYIGNIVYNRTTLRLGQKVRDNSPDLWVRAVGVFEPIVDPKLFQLAQDIKTNYRRINISNREMLARLSTFFREHGRVSRALIDECPYLPHSATYINRFGSMRNAYKRIEYYQKNSFDMVGRALTVLAGSRIESLADDLVSRVKSVGGTANFDDTNDELTINRTLKVTICVARCASTKDGWQRWTVRRKPTLRGDLVIALRMDRTGNIIDYLVLPVASFGKERIEFAETNHYRLAPCRFDHVEDLFRSVWRMKDTPSSFPQIKAGRPPSCHRTQLQSAGK